MDLKNVKSDTMLEIARVRARREQFYGKQSGFRVNKKTVGGSKIDRFMRRKDLSDQDVLSMPSPING
jgi:hypothetical protein